MTTHSQAEEAPSHTQRSQPVPAHELKRTVWTNAGGRGKVGGVRLPRATGTAPEAAPERSSGLRTFRQPDAVPDLGWRPKALHLI